MTETLLLRQSSMQFSDTKPEIHEDVLDVLVAPAADGAPDCIAFGEATAKNDVGPVVARVAARRGYAVHRPRGDVMFAVHPDNEVTGAGYEHVLDGHGGMPKGNYSDRGIAWVSFRTPGGNEVTAHAIHWLTGFRLDHNDVVENRREALHLLQTEAMIKAVVEHGKGHRLSFWQGDTNISEERDTGFDPNAIAARFKAAGLTSIYDEEYPAGADLPSTHGGAKGGTIDVIGSYDPDGRVHGKSVRVHGQRNSDHRIVDALFEIRDRRR